MKHLNWLFILLFLINYLPLSIGNPIITEIVASEPVNNSEIINSTLQEEWNSINHSNIVSTTPIKDEEEEEDIGKNNTSVSSNLDYVTEESETTTVTTFIKQHESDNIEDLLNSLMNKLKVPLDNWMNYHYIMAMKSPDGSIYVPQNHTQSTREHLITLLGFAEEIVSSKNGITNMNTSIEQNLPTSTEWTADEVISPSNDTSINVGNQSMHDTDDDIYQQWNVTDDNITSLIPFNQDVMQTSTEITEDPELTNVGNQTNNQFLDELLESDETLKISDDIDELSPNETLLEPFINSNDRNGTVELMGPGQHGTQNLLTYKV
ncbi:hypothetical protein MN116_004497 [Schistosoma mekongi]|uniref:Uncharacterized protein n=1 Tax=Schistosoma mekongi TaxID=38744 RepID=A0AAE2D7V9_SCHME|nr:hypothetical protein MN116_004497 [Schistosoma mekongi]